MKLHQLKALAMIAENGSIRAAARHLGISPAAITKSVRELEAELRAPLLNRGTSGVVFTEYGRSFLIHARIVLNQLDRAEAEIDAMRGTVAGKLSIGITPWLALTFLPETVCLFSKRMPDVRLEFFDGLLGVVQPLLRDGSLDFSIGRVSPVSPQSEFQTVPLFSVHAAVVARHGHPKADCRTLQELQDAEWVLNWDPASHEYMINDLYLRHGMRVPRTIHLAHSFTIVLGLVQKTDFLSIFPWPLVEAIASSSNLQALPLKESIAEGVISVVTKPDVPMSPAGICFIECLRDVVYKGAQSQDSALRRLFHSIELLF